MGAGPHQTGPGRRSSPRVESGDSWNPVAGATVWSGVMGYGAHGWIHRKGLFGVADEKPTGSNFFPPPWKTSRRTLTARRNPGLLSTSKSIFDELSWI